MTYIFNNRALSHITQGIASGDTQIRVPWPDFPMFTRSGSQDYMLVVLRGPTDREIVKIDIAASVDDEVDKYLTVERGQGGTGSQAWPAGTLIFLSTTADHYGDLFQPDSIRQVDYNPNGVITPLYRGEKLYQFGGCEIRWWESFDAVNPYWHLIAGVPCPEEEFLDPGWGFSPVWNPALLGDIFLIDTDKQGFGTFQNYLGRAWRDPVSGFLFIGTHFQTGLRSYSIDGSGVLTSIDSDTQGGPYNDAHGDSSRSFVFVAIGTPGVYVYGFDGSGNLTFLDEDYVGPGVGLGEYRGVWWDGNYLICACMDQGLKSYSVSAGGILTLVDTIAVPGAGQKFQDLWIDANFIYTCGYSGAGLCTYTIDGGGNFAFVDQIVVGSETYVSVVGNDDWIFVANLSDILRVFSRDGAGNLTYVSQAPYVFAAGDCVSVQDDIVLLGTQEHGLFSYKVDEFGALTLKDSRHDGSNYRGLWFDGTYHIATRYAAGVSTYEVV